MIRPKSKKERLMMDIDLEFREACAWRRCDQCNHTGYQGRLGTYELLITSTTFRQMIMERANPPMHASPRRVWPVWRPMRDDGWKKVLAGPDNG